MNTAYAWYVTNSILFGLAVGDALGVPVEFLSRDSLRHRPVKDLQGFGTHSQPAGTWSDDTALSLCLAENLANGFDIKALANSFVQWKNTGYWSAHGQVFDIGITTAKAISNLENGCDPIMVGGTAANENGNGSLMRIAPLAPFLVKMIEHDRYNMIRQVSSITHAHIRSVTACIIYVEFLRLIILKFHFRDAWPYLCKVIPEKLMRWGVPETELKHFERLLQTNIAEIKEDEIKSDGYVVHTLEASIWCLLTTYGYHDTVLKAVNLGSDTDTTATVTGALAGMIYGIDEIPPEWYNNIARSKDITKLAARMERKLCSDA